MVVPHAGVVNLLFGTAPQYLTQLNDFFALSTSYSFDHFVRKLYVCIGTLGRNVLAPDRQLKPYSRYCVIYLDISLC